jgi:hypothetical protein
MNDEVTPPASPAARRERERVSRLSCSIRSDAIDERVVDRVKVAIADEAGRASSALDLDAMVDLEPA